MENQAWLRSSLQLIFDAGVDLETGERVRKTKTYNNVKQDATGAQLFAVASALESLQQHTLSTIQRRDMFDIAG